jgi:hypothetical protein
MSAPEGSARSMPLDSGAVGQIHASTTVELRPRWAPNTPAIGLECNDRIDNLFQHKPLTSGNEQR